MRGNPCSVMPKNNDCSASCYMNTRQRQCCENTLSAILSTSGVHRKFSLRGNQWSLKFACKFIPWCLH